MSYKSSSIKYVVKNKELILFKPLVLFFLNKVFRKCAENLYTIFYTVRLPSQLRSTKPVPSKIQEENWIDIKISQTSIRYLTVKENDWGNSRFVNKGGFNEKINDIYRILFNNL